MKLLIAFLLIALAAADQYSTENDDFDVEKLVDNNEAMMAFVNCFVDNGPCDAVSADFKKDLPEAVQQACAKCTPAQKHLFKRFLEELKKKLPTSYETLQNKFDKEKKLFAPLEAAIAKA